jgi:hypothetical protein
LHFTLEKICSILEFVAVLFIIVLVWLGNRRHWHDRWIAYRLLAELVRQLCFVAPLGGARPFPRPVSSSVRRGNPVNSWMYWHLRSIDRDAGLPEAIVTGEYLRICLRHVTATVDGQINFHLAAAKSSRRLHHRLHILGFILFILTAALTLIHVLAIYRAPIIPEWLHGLDAFGFTFLCACLPAIGAAMAAISHQGEFARTARRSTAMVEQLTQIRAQLEPLLQSGANIRSADVAADALRAAQIMVDEVLDWRVVFLDRPLIASS